MNRLLVKCSLIWSNPCSQESPITTEWVDVAELVGAKLVCDCDEEVVNKTSCESRGLHQEDLLVLFVRWAHQSYKLDSRSTHSQLPQDRPDCMLVADNLDVSKAVVNVFVD